MNLKLVLLSVCLFVLFYPAQVQPAAVLESGIRVTPEAQKVIDTIKTGKQFRFVVLFVKNETTIDIESNGIRSSTYDDYLSKLKGKQCRYGLFDFEFQCQSDPLKKRDKLILMSWCPDSVNVRSKFIHAASVEGVKKAVGAYSAFVQASDDQEASLSAVQDKLQRTVTAC